MYYCCNVVLYLPKTTEETTEQKWPKECEEARKQAEKAIHE